MKVRLSTKTGSVELSDVTQINIDEALPEPVQIEVTPKKRTPRKVRPEATPALPMGSGESAVKPAN